MSHPSDEPRIPESAPLRGMIGAGVRNTVYANVLMICILAGGFLSATFLVRETYPEFSIDRLTIEIPYPGAGVMEVESGVTSKIEETIQGLAGVEQSWSWSDENGSIVVVELMENADARIVMLDIKDHLDRITTFPEAAERPVVSEAIVRNQVINVAVYGDAPERTIRELAMEVRNELLSDPHISQIEIRGIRDYEIAIQVSREALLRHELTLEQVAAVVARNCMDVPAGTLRTDQEEFTIRTTGQRYTAREFENMVIIADPAGTLIRLGQIASVSDGFEDDFRLGRFQGQRAAMIQIYKTADQDTSTIARVVREYVAEKKGLIPGPLNVDTWADSSREVDARVDMLVENGIWGMVFIVIVLSLFMDFRISLFVALGIPVSLAGAMIVMYFTSQTVNMITLFGLIMVTGIIVDDAIVVSDNFRVHRARGAKPSLAAVTGPTEVVLPVVASSITTIVAFAPLLFVAGVMGKFIFVLPVVVISAIVFSSVEVFCVLPAHLKHCMAEDRKDAGDRTQAGSSRRAAFRARIEHGIEWAIERLYTPIARRALAAQGLTLALAAAALAITAGWVLGGRIAFTLLPEVDADTIYARVQFPQGITLDRTMDAIGQLESAAERLNDRNVIDHTGDAPLVQRTYAMVGEWSRWYEERGIHLCEVMLELLPSEERNLPCESVLETWADLAGPIPDAAVVKFDRTRRGPQDKPLEVRLLGDDLEQLHVAAEDVAGALAAYGGVSGIEHDLLPGKREIRITLKPLARTLGVTVEDLARQLRSGFYGGEAVRIQRGRDEVRVQVRYPDAQRQSLSDLDNLRIQGPGGVEIPFRELADYDIDRGFAFVRHQDGQRRVSIQADIDERYANAEQILAAFEEDYLKTLADRYPGLRYRLEGQHAQIAESLGTLAMAFVFALVVIYAILATMLASYSQPIVIMVAIPLGFVGATLGHVWMGYDLTVMSAFGMVALSGVVVNDSLVLLDQINAGRREGRPLFDAVLFAGQHRFRAVVLTTITTLAGLMPLLLERSTQAQTLIPMAISLSFGLIVATVLTLIVVPALYLAAEDVQRFLRWVWFEPGAEESGRSPDLRHDAPM